MELNPEVRAVRLDFAAALAREFVPREVHEPQWLDHGTCTPAWGVQVLTPVGKAFIPTSGPLDDHLRAELVEFVERHDFRYCVAKADAELIAELSSLDGETRERLLLQLLVDAARKAPKLLAEVGIDLAHRSDPGYAPPQPVKLFAFIEDAREKRERVLREKEAERRRLRDISDRKFSDALARAEAEAEHPPLPAPAPATPVAPKGRRRPHASEVAR